MKFEAEGYPHEVEVPPYRQFPVTYTGSFNGAFGRMATNLPIPPALITSLASAGWLTHSERQSVGAIESLISATGGNLKIDASNLIIILGTKVIHGMACHDVDGWISRGSVVGMIDTLRARVLELAFQLENKIPGIHEVGVTQSAKAAEAKEYAMITNNITNNTVYGNQNSTSISNSGAGAQFTVEVHQRDVGALQKALTEIGFEPSDARELAAIVASEKPENAKEPFGKKATAWLGSNMAREFFGEVDPVRRQKGGRAEKRADSMPMETALGRPKSSVSPLQQS